MTLDVEHQKQNDQGWTAELKELVDYLEAA